MRKIKCLTCGEKWSGRRGSMHSWQEEHLRRHGLTEPKREEGESIDAWINRLIAWRKQYFDDSLYEEAE